MANRNYNNGGTLRVPVSSNNKQNNVLLSHSSLPKKSQRELDNEKIRQEAKEYVKKAKGLKAEMGEYHKLNQAAKSRGNMAMGVENMDQVKADAEKERLMKAHNISSEDFDKEYSSYSSQKQTEARNEKAKKDKKFAEEHPVLGSLKSIGTNLGSAAEGVANTLGLIQQGQQEKLAQKKKEFEKSPEYNDKSLKSAVKKAMYEGVKDVEPKNKIDTDKDYVMSNTTQRLREGASNNLGSFGKTAYNLGMSAADMATQAVIGALTGGTGAAMGALQGGQIANDMSKESLNRGNSALQAGLTGLATGGVTAGLTKFGVDDATEKIGEMLAKEGAKKGADSLGKAVLRGMLTEGAEEAGENIADEGIDKSLSKLFGGTSKRDEAINEYVKQLRRQINPTTNRPYTEEEAQYIASNMYKTDRAKEIGQDFGAGALFGGLFGAGNVAVNNLVGNSNPVVDSLITKNDANTNVNNNIQENIEAPKTEINTENDINNNPVEAQEEVKPIENTVPTPENNAEVVENTTNPYEEIERENLGTGISRGDKSSEIFRTSRKPWQGGAKQLMDNVLSMAWGREGMAENKELRLEFNKAFKDFVEQGNRESYENMMKLANEIMSKLPEENPVYPGGTRAEFESQLNYVLNRPEIANNMTIEDMWDVVRDPNTSIEDKQNKILDVINNWKGEEQHDKYLPEIERAMEFVRKLQASDNNVNPQTEVPTNLGLDTNNNNSFETPNGNTFTLTEDIGGTTENVTPVTNKRTENIEGDGAERHRSFTNSVDIPEEFRAEFKDDVYKQLSNKSTKQRAEDVLNNSKSLAEAEVEFGKMVDNLDAAAVPLGVELSNQYRELGEYDKATEIIKRISEKMTRGGQFTQAAYIVALKSDPLMVKSSMASEIEKINKSGYEKFGKEWNDFSLTPEEEAAFNNIKTGDTKALEDLTDSVYKRMAKELPHKRWEQFYDITKHCMLLNPRTHIRNMVANAVTMPVRSMTDRVKYVLEGMYGMVDKNYERTSSLKGGNKERKSIASKYFDDYIKDIIDDGGKYQESGLGRVEKESQLFKDTKIGKTLQNPTQKLANGGYTLVNALDRITGGKLNERTGLVDNARDFKDNKITGSVLENIRQLDYWLLGDVEDVPFVKQNFVNALANYMEAQKIDSPDAIPPEAVSVALDEALKATFKDDNAFTKALSSVKNSTGKFGQMVMPFTKTPANLAMRGIDYSPVGFINSFNNALKTKRANNGTLSNADISKVIGDLSKNVTGTALIFLGYELAKRGLITGDYSEDKNERNFQKMQGFQPNAFHIDGKYYTYDWSQPSSIPLIIGTSIYEGIQKDDAETNKAIQIAKSIKNGAVNSADAWFNLSPLQNVAEVMGGGDSASYGDNSIAQNIIDTVTEYPQTLIPTAVGANARAKDPVIRNTYDKTSAWNTYKNKAQAKIPGLSKELPASYDTWGRERKRSANEKDAAFAQYINPGTLGYENRSEVDDFVEGLFNATQDSGVFPRQAEYNIDGKQLNNKEYSERQREQGQKSLELVKAFEQVAKNSDLTPEEQADALGKIYSAAKQDTNNKLYGKASSMGKTEAEMYSQGAKVYSEYLRDYALAKRNGMKYDQYMKTISGEGKDSEEVKEAKEIKEATQEIKEETGNTINSNTYKNLTDKGASKEDIVFLAELKKNAKNNTEVLSYLGKQNMSDAERSKYIKLNASKGDLDKKYVQRGVEQFGESAYYQIFLNKANADLDHNGSLKNDEARRYVDKTYSNASERAKWYKILTGKDY